MSQTPIFHGSDLEQIASYYHIESDEICCFSANVNPLGFPEQTALAVCNEFFSSDVTISGSKLYRTESSHRPLLS